MAECERDRARRDTTAPIQRLLVIRNHAIRQTRRIRADAMDLGRYVKAADMDDFR
jgi:hypothetical protein